MVINYKSIFFIVFLFFVTKSNSMVKNYKNPDKPFIVVLDAGHGGHDPGNLGNGYREKDIVLKIVLEIGRILERQPDFKVIYTRKTDVFVKLHERAPIANRADADLFVSVHCDAFTNNAFGAGTFVLGLHKSKANFEVAKRENEVIFLEDDYEENYEGFDPNSPESLIGMTLMQEEYLDQSILLASLIQNNFSNNLNRKDRSVKQAGFMVLYKSYMPSVLIEAGFLTNKEEGAYLNSTKGQKEIANEIAKGIITYKKSLSVTNEIIQDSLNQSENINSQNNSPSENNYNGVEFRVQIAASSKKLEPKPYNFNGLKNIKRKKEGKLFKYYYGSTFDYDEILKLKIDVLEKGYNSCYIVAFKDGKKLKLSDVLISTNK
ncbi:MAG: N-acetylmuramoyl-L-alanine amidase [Flavobacteriales bacterium]|nr:MAG: N-acetylmuramoyl-L-alanine amidase [Flavobacteriales bacterium]